MRWKKGRRSSNVEDRRGRVAKTAGIGGGAAIIMLIAALLLGQDPTAVLEQLGGAGTVQQQAPASQGNDEASQFVSVVLADTEDVWTPIFAQAGYRYDPPKLVLYTERYPTACGTGQAAAGPFYCPGDQKVYLDLSFLAELQRLGATGDFAVAYVIAHEVGHHVQTLTGVSRQVQEARQTMSQAQGNDLQVRMELQADCYAGVWAHHGHKERQILERGDIEEGLAAAAAVGDDRLQKMAGRRPHPESFTHGTSEQRARWFRLGLQTGDEDACDTFGRDTL